MSGKKRYGAADIAMVVTTFFWGLNAVISKNAIGTDPDSFRVFVYNGLRIPAGTILLFMTLKLMKKPLGIRRQDLFYLAILSFFGLFAFMMAFILGVSLTSSANTGVILAMTPLLIVAISLLTRIERLTGRVATGLAVGFCGMIVLTFQREGLSFNAGDGLILLSCFAWAVHTVYGKKLLNTYSPMVVTAWVYLFTSLYQLPFTLYQLPSQQFAMVSTVNWMYLLISIIGSVYMANTLYFFAVNEIGPSRAGIYTNLTPVFTLLLAVMIRSETISLNQIAGLFLIVIGIALLNSFKMKSKKS